ncbi:MAG: TraG/TraD/VirD4 family protein, partial [Lawsonibacter sp.]
SALVSLELFTDPAIHSMTASTDFDLYATGKKKRALFLILPDHKSTYYPLAALFVYQQYQILVDVSDASGNRLPRRVNFLADELGNFTKITDFDKMVTVGAGRGIRLHMFLQDFNQLDERYGDKIGRTIRSNADTWIYLKSKDPATLKEFSDALGPYTVKSPSLSGSTGGNMSASYNLTGRPLLMPSEIDKIKRPYQLVKTDADPVMMYAPDLSKTIFNQMLGLGSKKHNKEVICKRQAKRPEHPVESHYWNIWTVYQRLIGRPAQTA